MPLLQPLGPLPAPPPSPLPCQQSRLQIFSLRTVIKFPRQFSSEVKPSHFPPPALGRDTLTGQGEVIGAIRGVAGIGASGQQQGKVHPASACRLLARLPTQAAAASDACLPVLEHQPRSPEGGLPGKPSSLCCL